MSSETETITQTQDSSLDTIYLTLRQEPEMHFQENEFSAKQITLKSVDERIKQATDPYRRRVEYLCALLARGTELGSAGNSEATGSRRDNTSASPTGNRHDTLPKTFEIFFVRSFWHLKTKRDALGG